MKILAEPLSPAELDALEELILQVAETAGHPDDDRIYDADSLDGYLTGIVIGPDTLMPGEWLPALFGGKLPRWKSPQQFEQFMNLVTRHMNTIAESALQAPPRFHPQFAVERVGRQEHVIVGDWCFGFLQAVALRPKLWKALLNRRDEKSLLYPIWLFGTGEGDRRWEELLEGNKKGELRAQWIERLRQSVSSIHAHWLPYREKRLHEAVRQ